MTTIQTKSIQLDDLTVNNIGVLRKINETVLPTKYSDKWYDESLKLNDELVQLAFYDELPVGGIRCGLDVPQNHNAPTRIYIMTLAVLKPYRGLKIGQKLINHVIEYAKKIQLPEISAHAKSDDEQAIKFYEKQGFEKSEEIKGYYNELGDAWLLVKKL